MWTCSICGCHFRLQNNSSELSSVICWQSYNVWDPLPTRYRISVRVPTYSRRAGFWTLRTSSRSNKRTAVAQVLPCSRFREGTFFCRVAEKQYFHVIEVSSNFVSTILCAKITFVVWSRSATLSAAILKENAAPLTKMFNVTRVPTSSQIISRTNYEGPGTGACSPV